MRLDRPVGSLLLLWPTLAALWMAADGLPPIGLLVIFTLGTFVMRSAGCVINDYADRHVDGSVKRTQNRPLVTGAVTPRQALLLFAALALIGGVLILFLNRDTQYLAIAGLAIVATYPFFKRWTYLPQVALGAAFSWGILMAWTATGKGLDEGAGLMFVGSVLWIVAYDTMYAMVDRDDDLKIGVKSTAILFGNLDRAMIAILQLATLVCWYLLGQQQGFQHAYFVGLAGCAGLFVYQLYLIRKRARDRCFLAFANNIWAGFSLFLGTFVEFLLRDFF